jgi:hypothetical protein
MKIIKSLIVILSLALFSQSAFASRGGVDKDGCHVDKKTDKHHCHNKKAKGKKSKKSKK